MLKLYPDGRGKERRLLSREDRQAMAHLRAINAAPGSTSKKAGKKPANISSEMSAVRTAGQPPACRRQAGFIV